MQTFHLLYNSVIGLCAQFNERWQKLISVDSIFNELIPSATYTDKPQKIETPVECYEVQYKV